MQASLNKSTHRICCTTVFPLLVLGNRAACTDICTTLRVEHPALTQVVVAATNEASITLLDGFRKSPEPVACPNKLSRKEIKHKKYADLQGTTT